ncbi:probable protein S-acyltransferase 17, partial [Tanacetum coccineum]
MVVAVGRVKMVVVKPTVVEGVNDNEKDDSPVEEVSPVKLKKPTRRAARSKKNDPKEPPKEWTVGEEIALYQAWCDENGSSRGYDSILSKWKNRVRLRIGAFCAIINNVKDNHESGSNDLDMFQKVCAEYKIIYRQDFTLEHCYNILKDHQGWLDIEMPSFYKNAKGRKKSKTFETTSGSASGGFNLNNEADEAEEETQEVRPPGRNQSKAKKKSAASFRGKSSSFVDLVADKFLNIKKDKWNKREEQKQSYIQLKNRELDIREA